MKEYAIQIINSKQILNHRLVLKKLHRSIRFNQESRLKPYIDMNTELKKIEYFLKLMNNAVFVEAIENVERIRNIKNELFHVKAK